MSNSYLRKSSLPKRFPQIQIFILHNKCSDKMFLQYVSGDQVMPYESTSELVGIVRVSDFSSDFMPYSYETQVRLYEGIIILIGYAAMHMKKHRGERQKSLPGDFKKLAKKAIRTYQQIMGNSFLTRSFVRKVYATLHKIWLHAKAYYRWCERFVELQAKLL